MTCFVETARSAVPIIESPVKRPRKSDQEPYKFELSWQDLRHDAIQRICKHFFISGDSFCLSLGGKGLLNLLDTLSS